VKVSSEREQATKAHEKRRKEKSATATAPTVAEFDYSYVSSDLRHSLIITIAIISTIIGLALSQSQWPKLANLAKQILPL